MAIESCCLDISLLCISAEFTIVITYSVPLLLIEKKQPAESGGEKQFNLCYNYLWSNPEFADPNEK